MKTNKSSLARSKNSRLWWKKCKRWWKWFKRIRDNSKTL